MFVGVRKCFWEFKRLNSADLNSDSLDLNLKYVEDRFKPHKEKLLTSA